MSSSSLSSAENLRGALLMVLAMAGFALEDMLVKQLAMTLPLGEVLVIIGVGTAAFFWFKLWRKGLPFFGPHFLEGRVILRNVSEMLGAAFFILAITLGDLSVASAILQALPLIVTMGAAAFLGHPVGWRRWCAIGAGLVGVLLILQPDVDGIAMPSLLAAISVIFLAIRDVATRTFGDHIASLQLAGWGYFIIIPLGIVMQLVSGDALVLPGAVDWVRLLAVMVIGAIAYYCLILASRIGNMAVVAPFRTARVVFALFIGVLVFNESLDFWMMVGICIIVSANLYMVYRESLNYRRKSPKSNVAKSKSIWRR